MKNYVKYSMIFLLLLLSLSGCKQPLNDEDIEIDTAGIEPSLTKQAKKLYQFQEIKDDDILAEIDVKDYGVLKVKLFPEKAPKAVENFIELAKSGYYDGVTFHRVIKDFMIQGGDPTGTGTGGESIWKQPFEDEISDELYPYRGALCMANSGKDTNQSQFFIVQADANEIARLEELFTKRYGYGMVEYVKKAYQVELSEEEMERFTVYGGTPWLTGHHTIFGQVIEGFDVLDAIANTTTTSGTDVPVEPIIITTIKIDRQGH